MLDGLFLEKQGIPSIVISTNVFAQQCQAMASAHNFTNYSFVQIAHPISTASVEALEKEADRVLNEALELLMEGAS